MKPGAFLGKLNLSKRCEIMKVEGLLTEILDLDTYSKL